MTELIASIKKLQDRLSVLERLLWSQKACGSAIFADGKHPVHPLLAEVKAAQTDLQNRLAGLK